MKHKGPGHGRRISNASLKVAGKHFLVYLLWCPIKKQVCYVGYTKHMPGERLGLHIGEAKKNTKAARCRWIKSLLDAGHEPTMRLVGAFSTMSEALAYEAALIASISPRRQLTNAYPGYPNWGA